jgi:hypothetical protein
MFAGPKAAKPVVQVYRGYSFTEPRECTKVRNISGQDLTQCTLDVLVEFEGGPVDHSIYYFDRLANNDAFILQQNTYWQSETTVPRGGLPALITYSLWAKELQQPRQVCLAASTRNTNLSPTEVDEERRRENAGLPPSKAEKPEETVRRLSPQDEQALANNRAALLSAIDGKT